MANWSEGHSGGRPTQEGLGPSSHTLALPRQVSEPGQLLVLRVLLGSRYGFVFSPLHPPSNMGVTNQMAAPPLGLLHLPGNSCLRELGEGREGSSLGRSVARGGWM